MFEQSIGLGHVGLNVTDLDQAEAFFARTLGFVTLARSDFNGSPFALLGHRGQMTLTLWQQSAGAFSSSQPGLHHLAFQVEDSDRLKEVYARLQSAEVCFLYEGIVPHVEGGNSSAVYFEGPDGVRLEVYAPNGGKDLAAPVPGAPACGFF